MTVSQGYQLTPRRGSQLMIFNEDNELVNVATTAFNVVFKDQEITRTKGYETLEFSIATSSNTYPEVIPERVVKLDERYFRIKLIEEVKYNSNTVKVTCYARWYEWAEGPEVAMNFAATTLGAVFDALSIYSELEIAAPKEVRNIQVRGLTSKINSRLYQLRYILKQYDLVLVFGYKNDGQTVVALPQKLYEDRVESPLTVGRNIDKITRTVDSRSLCTRYTLIGKDGITASSINGGKEYVENFQWFDQLKMKRRIIPQTKEDDRFTDKENMIEAMKMYLQTYSRALVSYEVNAILYDTIPELLQYQLILDADLKLTEWRKVSSRQLDYLSITGSRIIFDDPRQTLIDMLNSDEEL